MFSFQLMNAGGLSQSLKKLNDCSIVGRLFVYISERGGKRKV